MVEAESRGFWPVGADEYREGGAEIQRLVCSARVVFFQTDIEEREERYDA